MDEPERNPNDMSRADNGAGRAAPSGPPTAESEALRRALRLTLKGYQRALPCSCHDGVGTNGGCKHSNLRQIILRATPAEPGASPPDLTVDAFARLDRLDAEMPERRGDLDTIRAALMVACSRFGDSGKNAVRHGEAPR
jgi:hypothetical protein